MGDIRARQVLLRKLLAAHAQRLAQGRFFDVQLGLVYPGEKGRLGAYALPFVPAGYFGGNASFNQRVDQLTVQATDPGVRPLIAAKVPRGFTGLAVVANAVWDAAQMPALAPQHMQGCLLAALAMLDETTTTAMWHLASGSCEFPQEGDLPPWDLDSVFQLLYALDDLPREPGEQPGAQRGPSMLDPGGGQDARRLDLPDEAQGVKRPATLLIL